MATDPERAEEEMEELEDEKDILSSQIMRRPEILAAMQGRPALNTFAMMRSLPPNVKRRIKALKKLQLNATNLEARFYEEVHELECKYHHMYSPLYDKRASIVTGTHEPNEDECDFPSDDESNDNELAADMKAKVKIEEVSEKENESENADKANGVPEFWLTIFKNVGMLNEMVQSHDEPILKHLIDIKVIFLKADPMGFLLEFHFSPNDYFTNAILTKEYLMKCGPDKSDPFSFEGPEIYKCKGCVIDWKKGKNVTVKTVKKRQKHKSRGSLRTIMKTIQNDSFFNFFSPPCMPEDPDAELDNETQELLTSDFEIGHYIRERIVPRAVLYFTGEALEDEEDDFEEEEGEEGEEEEDDGDDDDDDDEVKPGPGGKKAANNGQPGDCKQQ